ncbi:hypothetical protein ACKUB1_13730 [Methanospirillum stamsii]|uniref:Uncharacterized protein n=1 Tax=Methanospirillum stamsii TaxID=1277351 RepID=A0A2V2NHM8_9EURY|nr:hypothetical protein [Methanospirillum stamsii]PWR74833.1 hypothetical protein DLD82_08015 [Methanospirillum stamsii]
MNYHQHYPGTIPAFQELKNTDKAYFPPDDKINLSESDRLLFLSHFTAIGKMWDYLDKYYKKREKSFEEKWNICSIIWEDCGDYCTISLKVDEKEYYIETDTLGDLYDTDLPDDDDDSDSYPKLAYDICHEYYLIWKDVESRIKSFCHALGYNAIWDECSLKLEGNWIKTEGYAWSDDLDPYFENMRVIS